MLSVLPREMEEIRASQSVILAREEMFKKKEADCTGVRTPFKCS